MNATFNSTRSMLAVSLPKMFLERRTCADLRLATFLPKRFSAIWRNLFTDGLPASVDRHQLFFRNLAKLFHGRPPRFGRPSSSLPPLPPPSYFTN